MESEKQHILEKARKAGLARPSAGLEVSEGYFGAFADRLIARLPERAELEHPDDIEAEQVPRTFWQHVRPYVYMAAMFAGVWLMLQMFTMLTGTGRLQPIESNPMMAEALGNDIFVDQYVYDDIDSWDIVDEMVEDGSLDSTFEFVFDEEPAEIPDDVILPQ